MKKVEHNRAKPANFITSPGVQKEDGTVEFDVQSYDGSDPTPRVLMAVNKAFQGPFISLAQTDSDNEGDVVTDTEAETEADNEADTEADAEADADVEADTEADSETDKGMDVKLDVQFPPIVEYQPSEQGEGGRHDDEIVEISCYDTWQTPANLIELSRGKEATIMIRKPNKGVNTSSDSVSTFWVETVLKDGDADKVFKLTYEGKFYKSDTEGWTNDSQAEHAGNWPYYGWTITANEEFRGLGAFMLEGVLLSCPSETLSYNKYEDRAYRVVVKVVD